MTRKGPLFLSALLHSFPSTFYLYGQPFYAQKRYGWEAGLVGLSQALTGLCIILGSYVGGQIAHRRHPHLAMRLGLVCGIVGTCLGYVGAVPFGVTSLLISMAIASFGQAVVWPAVEAALSANEPLHRIQHYTGLFNITWSFGTSTAFFATTPLLSALGLPSLFLLPACFYCVHLFLGVRVFRYSGVHEDAPTPDTRHPIPDPHSVRAVNDPSGRRSANRPADGEALQESPPSLVRNERQGKGVGGLGQSEHLPPTASLLLRRMGWIGNSLTYLAISMIVTYSPTIRVRLGLDFAEASIWCSLWFYARTLCFEAVRRWTWWHYRWKFLCGCYTAAILSFVGVVLAPSLTMLLLMQLLFGFSQGLVYQSSLFYSMAESDAQGENGGIHESLVGLGILLGPLLTYLGATLAPQLPTLPVACVGGLMSVGLAVLLTMGLRISAHRPREQQATS